jgi:hypothetical protein
MRNAATIGGNIATASPAGDGLPVLLAADALLVLASRHGERTVPLGEFVTGVKRTVLQPGEIITRVRVPRLTGPQEFLKVGTRNAMVISICCAALLVDRAGHTVRIGLGSVAPTPVRAPEAESYIAAELDWDALSAPAESVARFGELVRDAVRPITDHRSTATLVVQVIATRAHRGAWHECFGPGPPRRCERPARSDHRGQSRQPGLPGPDGARDFPLETYVLSNGATCRSTTPGWGRACSTCCAAARQPGAKNACNRGVRHLRC